MKKYDPLSKPPAATPVGDGSGAGNPTQPATAPLRRDNTASGFGRSLADVFAEAQRKDNGNA